MAVKTSILESTIIRCTTGKTSEWGFGRVPLGRPEFEDPYTPTTKAVAEAFLNYLNTFNVNFQEDVISVLKEHTGDFGVVEDTDMWRNYFGVDMSKDSKYENHFTLEKQITTSVDTFLGFSIWKTLEENRQYHDDADLLVQIGTNLNAHLSMLHFGPNHYDKLNYRNFSKQMYDYIIDDDNRTNLFHKELGEKLVKLGIDPLIGNIRMHYDEMSKVLSWKHFEPTGSGEYRTKYQPRGEHSLCAVCGIDGSGKTSLLDKLGRVVLPIAHPNDPKMKKFFEGYSDYIDYGLELEVFNASRKSALKGDLTIMAYRFIRSIFTYLNSKFEPFTIFQNIVLDRSSLTNIAYVDRPVKFGEAVDEFIRDFFLNPYKIAVIDTPVSIAYARATEGREGHDEFDNAEFGIYVRRATMYRILAGVLPNVDAINTYDSERDEIFSKDALVPRLKELLYGDENK
ncbi:hypothetical protein HYV12_01455 [Candidatus Dojkabacteria bacterium]|nr:hypothetical protein [Candidatus Dojkabacteria bacterium]